MPMVSYMKVRNKSKKNVKFFYFKFATEWHCVYNVVDVNTAYNNFIQKISHLFSKCCPIIIIKSKVKKNFSTMGDCWLDN